MKDEGPGLSSTANLFVPFFTTKPGGSGIGLVLSRQIKERRGRLTEEVGRWAWFVGKDAACVGSRWVG